MIFMMVASAQVVLATFKTVNRPVIYPACLAKRFLRKTLVFTSSAHGFAKHHEGRQDVLALRCRMSRK
jgi:hypothetical protein